ncbi:MAG: hexose-phosphate transporter, major isoform [Monoraphidium minutum]|nr:MAG: hexose-phosphate transporter, major isoform [Monoraphidium minutum]
MQALASTPLGVPAPQPRPEPAAQQQQALAAARHHAQQQQHLAAAPAARRSADDKPLEYPREFTMRRLLVFASIVLGYSCYYLTRNSLTYTAPVMVADPKLGMDITQIGAMTSIFPIAYGMSKFVSGVLGARFSPSVLLAGGLMATALINIAFGFGASLGWFCFFWALNGTLQGVGGPCCARILTTWFASKERGTYWGMWNIAHNLGGFAAPLVAGGFAKAYGWKWGMWAPGIIGLVVGVFVLLACRDKPEDVGFPPVEPAAAPKPGASKKKPDVLKQLVNTVLKNPFIWGMALTYFFIYIVRQGVTSWFVFYLIKEKGVVDAADAAVRVSGLELGGLFGSLLAGRISDMLITKSGGKGGNVGKRVRVVMAYTVGIAVSLLTFQACPASASALQWLNVFMIGFFLYGPQMLIGLCGAELVGPDSVGASEGFLGWIAYLGAANAGIPLSIIVKDYGWSTYFSTLVGACALALLLLAPMTNLRSYVQRREQRRLRKGL